MAKYIIKYYTGIDQSDINNEICVADYNGDVLKNATIEISITGFSIFFDRFDSPGNYAYRCLKNGKMGKQKKDCCNQSLICLTGEEFIIMQIVLDVTKRKN